MIYNRTENMQICNTAHTIGEISHLQKIIDEAKKQGATHYKVNIKGFIQRPPDEWANDNIDFYFELSQNDIIQAKINEKLQEIEELKKGLK